MKRAIFIYFAITIMSFSYEAYGQYLPVGLMPMQYNDGFAGSVGNSRICVNGMYSYQDIEINLYQGSHVHDTKNHGFYSSFDRFYPGIKSGIGINVERNYEKINHSSPNFEWERELIQTTVTAILAPKFSIKGKYTLSPSINLSFINQDILYDEIFDSENTNYELNTNGITSRVGILFNARHYYVGYAVRLYKSRINEIGIYAYDFYSILQLGYTFQRDEDSKFSITTQLAMAIHSKPIYSDQITNWPSYILSFRYDSFIFGALSQFEYAYPMGFQLGWQNKGWRLLISNEFANGYNANLTFRYIFNQKKKFYHILNSMN